MEKPFDVKELTARLKAKGLDVAEEAAKILATETVDWVSESCALHENVFVKMGGPMVQAVKPILLAEIDKIDGQVG